MEKDLERRTRFFQEHAGYATPPGRMACAKALAQAEIEAEANEFTFEWEGEQDPDWSWFTDSRGRSAEPSERDIQLCCLLKDEDGKVLASLGGIHFNTWNWYADPYRRVVEAELASEALASDKVRGFCA